MEYGNAILIYSLDLEKLDTLFLIYDDIAWSPNFAKIMFVIVNQNRTHGYREFTRIIVVTIDSTGSPLYKEKYDRL